MSLKTLVGSGSGSGYGIQKKKIRIRIRNKSFRIRNAAINPPKLDIVITDIGQKSYLD